jgi:uncharacterized protein involved in exopolysaccharide biosynthesis
VVDSIRRIFSRERRPITKPSEQQGLEGITPVNVDEMKDQALSVEELQKLEPYEDTLIGNLKVEPVVGTALVTLRFTHTNPEMAKKVTDTLADLFVYNNLVREETGSERNEKLLGERIAELQIKTRQMEEQKFNFAQRNGLPMSNAPGADLEASRLSQLSKDLLDAENKRKDYESLWRAAGASVDPNDIPEVQDNKRIQILREQLDKLVTQRAELLQVYTEEWPEVKKLDSKIETIKESLDKAPREVLAGMKSRFEAARAKEDSLRRAYMQQKGTTTAQSLAQIQMGTLLSDLETNKQELNILRQRQREIEGGQQDRVNNVSVSSYSRLPRGPVGPARARNIVLALCSPSARASASHSCSTTSTTRSRPSTTSTATSTCLRSR